MMSLFIEINIHSIFLVHSLYLVFSWTIKCFFSRTVSDRFFILLFVLVIITMVLDFFLLSKWVEFPSRVKQCCFILVSCSSRTKYLLLSRFLTIFYCWKSDSIWGPTYYLWTRWVWNVRWWSFILAFKSGILGEFFHRRQLVWLESAIQDAVFKLLG